MALDMGTTPCGGSVHFFFFFGLLLPEHYVFGKHLKANLTRGSSQWVGMGTEPSQINETFPKGMNIETNFSLGEALINCLHVAIFFYLRVSEGM